MARSVESLPKGTIDLKRMKDANSAKRAQAVVRSVEFHPTANVLLTAGYHKTVDLFQVCVWLKLGNLLLKDTSFFVTPTTFEPKIVS